VAGDCIQGFRPSDGRRLWSLFAQGEGVVPTPVAGDGLLFTSSGFEATTLRAVRLGPNPAVVWEDRKGVPTRPSLLYVSPHLYAVTDAGIASCWEGATGKLVWRERLTGAYSASPVFADGRIYCLNEDGETTVLAAGPEFRILARNPLGAKCQASMAVARGQLFIRTERQLVAIGRARD
jgi:outer membrane protein assembly factor BamB